MRFALDIPRNCSVVGELYYQAGGARGSQRDLTSIIERQRASKLGADIDALPDADEGQLFSKLAYHSVDRNSSIWVASIPTRHRRLGPAEFRETTATYFGAPSPVASALEGQGIWSKTGDHRGVCDKYGLKLASLNIDGRWTEAHDSVKYAIARALKMLGVGHMTEVHGLFTSVIPPGNMANARRAMQGHSCGGGGNGQRQGLVPDFKVEIEGLNDGAAATSALVELKMLHCGRTPTNTIGGSTYPTRGNTSVLSGHRRAVHQRAERIQRERERDARTIDRRFCATPPGQDVWADRWRRRRPLQRVERRPRGASLGCMQRRRDSHVCALRRADRAHLAGLLRAILPQRGRMGELEREREASARAGRVRRLGRAHRRREPHPASTGRLRTARARRVGRDRL